MSETKDKSQIIQDNEELLKALTDLGIDITTDDIKKAKGEGDKGDSKDYRDEKGDVPGEQNTGPDEREEEDEEDEKEKGKSEKGGKDYMKKSEELDSEIQEIEKSLAEKRKAKEELEKSNKPAEAKEEDKQDDINKSESADIIKSFITGIKEDIDGLKSSVEISTNIQKSLSDLTDQINTIAQNVENLGASRQGKRSIDGLHIIEKSQEANTDDEGKKVLSVSRNRDEILKSVENIYEKETDSIKKGELETFIVGYTGGGAMPSQNIVKSLYEEHNIRLVK